MLLRLLFFICISLMSLNIAVADAIDKQCNKSTAFAQQCANSKPLKKLLESKQELTTQVENRWWFAKTYDAEQERVFMRLQSEFKQNPWAVCSLKTGAQPVFSYDKNLRNTTPINIFADSSEMFDAELMSFAGDIDLQRADQHLMANQADYNQASEVFDLYGNVLYSETGMALYGTSAKVDLQQDTSLLRNVSFIIPSSPMRGSADVIYRDSSALSRYKNVTYTACEPGNQDWLLHASRMKVNNDTGRVAIKHGWMEFKSIPVMYVPYGSFPVDERRLTGLLTPSMGISGRSGFDVSLPFYWNMAANYDLTLTPRYMTKRGFMMGTDFRYLWHKSAGQINVEVMPEDSQTKELRWGGSLQHTTWFSKELNLAVDGSYVSDKSYFSDLDGTLGVNNRNRYLESDAKLAYTLPWMTLTSKVEHFQNIDPNAKNSKLPYRRLPQIKLDMFKAFGEFPLELDLDSEYVFFQRHFPDGRPEGQRFNIKPSVSFPFESRAGFIIPKVALQHTQYWLSNPEVINGSSLSKTLPVVSLDSGLFFERDFESLTHTIEPRLYYLYVPYTDQSDLPNFDTSGYDFNISQLFRDNEFNGVDKTQNANQITLALTSRLIDEGRDRLKLTVGEKFYFADRKVNLAGETVHTEVLSNLIAELKGEITDELKLTSAMQWSHEENQVDRGSADLRYHGEDNNAIFNIGYRYRHKRAGQAGQEQIVASAIIPIYDGWSVIGLYRHSLFDSKTLEYFYGLEKDSCCWRFRVVARQFIRTTLADNSAEIKPETSVFFQLELKGLTSLGDKLDSFLFENISGYRKPVY